MRANTQTMVMARMAQAASHDRDWKSQGLDVTHGQLLKGRGGAECFACLHEGDVYFAVRGTSDPEDVVRDLQIGVTREGSHDGFSKQASALWSLIEKYYDRMADEGAKTHLCGHSLGGAVAILLGLWLKRENYRVGSIRTFGAPRVGNEKLQSSILKESLDIQQFVVGRDIVPTVPPMSLGFRHPTLQQYHIKKSGNLATIEMDNPKENRESWLSEKLGIVVASEVINIIRSGSVDDHSMSTYVERLENEV